MRYVRPDGHLSRPPKRARATRRRKACEWDAGPYYWRIDELNTDGTITKGRLWQFTVADFILVDDFETYNDINPEDEGSNRIYATWIDGWGTQNNGAIVGYANPDFAAGQHVVETQVVPRRPPVDALFL